MIRNYQKHCMLIRLGKMDYKIRHKYIWKYYESTKSFLKCTCEKYKNLENKKQNYLWIAKLLRYQMQNLLL